MSTKPLQFQVHHTTQTDPIRKLQGRVGELTLYSKEGEVFKIQTPQFMPVGTVGSVKSITPFELKKCRLKLF